ncbi:uncharacterized protein LOC110451938 [Mizuhopecten yessoensis]|uniref:Mammalian ependymin-related protein 1 n=1 Tax=Mizuhopecten yessoensis TaxID=6573 RepID=A0A210QKR3_MIZYE|nr:uncharacterized protein LOC110451938 [Mizuhopecten yessoensis]OWF49344.1 hypothetical protein KP79_PYT14693 [Mizuhopecten yessoensis]
MADAKLILLSLWFFLGTCSTSDKLRCRFPAQWQSNVYFDFGLMFTVPTQARASGIYYYDYTNNQTRLDLKGIDLAYNTSYDYTFLWKFNESAFYTIDYINKSCDREVQQSDFWRQWEGVPGEASPTYFGGIGGNQERFGQYQFLKLVKHSDNETLAVAIDVKVGDVCPPSRLVLEEYGFDPLGVFAYNYEFLDPSDIQNPKVFNNPTNCKNITTAQNVHRNRLVHRHVGLFVG